MRDDDLRANVTTELMWDPRVDSRNIVVSEVALASAPGRDRIEQEIDAALRRSARLALDDLSVDARPDGTVTLAGTVASCPEHEEALTAA
jgi:BON domain